MADPVFCRRLNMCDYLISPTVLTCSLFVVVSHYLCAFMQRNTSITGISVILGYMKNYDACHNVVSDHIIQCSTMLKQWSKAMEAPVLQLNLHVNL